MNLVDFPSQSEPNDPAVQLKKLSPRHKEVMSLLAQGVDRQVIAKMCQITPEYVTWLARQPLCREYVKEMSEFVNVRLEALFGKTADVIAETLECGTEDGKLKAARMQLEVTGRVGRAPGQVATPTEGDFLETLAERLVSLQRNIRRRTVDGEVTDVQTSAS
ncbi:MAG: hypothetical protein ACYDB1_00870 [Acidiferrobacteraceae bacterium]